MTSQTRTEKISTFGIVDSGIMIHSSSVSLLFTLLLGLGLTHSVQGQDSRDSAYVYYKDGNYAASLPHFDKAFAESLVQDHPDSFVVLANRYGNALLNSSQFWEAIQFYDSTYTILVEKKASPESEITILNSLAFCLISIGEYSSALGILDETRLMADSNNITSGKAFAKTNEYLASTHLGLGNLEDARSYLDKAKTINEAVYHGHEKDLGLFYNNAGGIIGKLENNDSALEYYVKALDILMHSLDSNHTFFGTIYNNIGTIYADRSDYQKAIEYVSRSLDIARASENKFSELFALINLGNFRFISGDYDRSTPLLLNALELSESLLGEKNLYKAGILDMLSELYTQENKFDLAIETATQSLDIRLEMFSDAPLDIAFSYFAVANAYQKAEQFEQALHYGLQGLRLREKILVNDVKLANSHYQVGEIYIFLQDLKQAQYHLQEALRIFEDLGYKQSAVMDVYTRFGDMAREEGNIPKALNLYKRGLQALLLNADPGHSDAVPAIENLQFAPNLQIPINGIIICNMLLYQKDSITYEKNLLSALDYCQLGINYFNRYTATSHSESSNYIWANYTGLFYNFGIEVAYTAYKHFNDPRHINLAWELISKLKYQSLRRVLQQDRQINFTGLPRELIDEEFRLKSAISSQQRNLVSDTISSYEELTNLQLEHSILMEQIKKDYPKYYQLRFDQSIPSIDDIQQTLTDTSQILQYFVSDNYFHVISVTRDHVAFYEAPLEKPVFNGLLDSITYSLRNQDCSVFEATSLKVKSIFFTPFADTSKREFIIIPHDRLYQINFEFLADKKQKYQCDFSNLSYLIEKYQFRYVYLPEELLGETMEVPNVAVLAVAPGFDQDIKDGYVDSRLRSSERVDSSYLRVTRLPWAVETAEELKKNIRARTLINEEATEENVKSIIPDYGILHFGTHAEVNDTNPLNSHLILNKSSGEEDGYLHNYEIYNLPLRASLVSLTACETGIGKLQAGEGMLSMARAFRYAGCPSIAMSLWKIDDQSSAKIMQGFYANLNQKMPKHTALRKAKLEFLSSSPQELSNPLFWAGMIVVGNVSPVQISTGGPSNVIWIVGLGVLTIGLGVWYFKFR